MRNNDLVNTIQDCITACTYCSNKCLEEDDVKAMIDCIRTDRDCIQICRTAHHAVVTHSKFQSQILNLCADICDSCAQECSKHDDEHCKKCADACRKCAQECREAA